MKKIILFILLLLSFSNSDLIKDADLQREMANTAAHVMYPACINATAQLFVEHEYAELLAVGVIIAEEASDTQFSWLDIGCGLLGIYLSSDYIYMKKDQTGIKWQIKF